MASLRSFNWMLQQQIGITDNKWTYQVPNLPSADKRSQARLIQSIAFVSSTKEQHVKLRLETAPSNRVTWSEPLDHFVLLSFSNFRLREPAARDDGQVSLAPARDSAEYIARLLKAGIRINGKHYNFFGHSNSQLKSRSCFMFAASKDEISAKVQSMGDFSKMKTVAKLAKRIGLLFSSAEMAAMLQPDRCEDIDDITIGDYCFTDGCGLISKNLTRLVVQRKSIVFRNKRYHPSVFQIRYRGYKGVLTVDPYMKGKTLAKFRQSMKKFNAHGDLSLSVVEYSKPYTFGFLNDEIVLLLNALGVSTQRILQKQQDYLTFLDTVFDGQPLAAFQFLSFIDSVELAEKLLMEGIESVRSSLRAAVRQEQSKMLNKYEEQRCRIMIRQSRLLFGICDPTGTPSKAGLLKPGTCFVRVTLDGTGEPRTLVNTEVLVTRNPCLHPGDLQKFRAVDVPELAHICDAIIFPTTGQRPSADLMSGGDLDGDKFFVTWDPDLIPSTISQPAVYPGVKERITFQAITDDDRADFFAKYTNASLGRVKNLYLKWARLKGSMSAECQQLNRLFSQCVDGNRIRVPQNLEDPPEPSAETLPFILDILHEAATNHIRTVTDRSIGVAELTEDMTELIASREDFALSEFELIQLVMRKCSQDGIQFAKYAPMFNYQALTDEQQAWLIARLPPIKGIPGLVRNGLMQSELVVPAELRPFRLDDPRLHWKSVFRSSDDRLGRFLHAASRSLELFHKKLIILQADERLTLMIYIPHKIPRASEAEVGDSVRIFALPRSSGLDSVKYHVTPSKSTSRLYCDGNTFQLYEYHRQNTFVYLTRGPQDQASYQQLTSAGDRRRQKQQTLDDGTNFDNRASVALNKISGPIANHVGRMNRSGIAAAEIYVISNRDVESMRLLDQWLHYVDTQEVLPLFESTNTEYRAPTLESLDRDSIPQNVANVVWDKDLNSLRSMTSVAEIRPTLQLLASINQSTQLRAVCTELINIGTNATGPLNGTVISRTILRFLSTAPYLTELFLGSQLWQNTRAALADEAEISLLSLMKELVLSTNRMQAFVRAPFIMVLREMKQLSIQSLAEIIELVALTVEQPEFALDLLLQCLEPETSRLLLASPLESQQLTKSLAGIALDHIDEASSGRVAANQTFSVSRDGSNEGFEVLKAITRIDAPGGHAKIGDHVRLIATSPPQNAPLERPYAMDALVIGSEQGAVRFRCIHHVPAYVADCTWKLRQCGSFVTAKAMFDAVTALYGTKAVSCGIYKQLIGLRADQNQADQGADKPATQPDLNDSQNRALKAVSAHSLTLLWGLPGTGKTYTVVRILKHLLVAHPEHRFLVTAPTHNAVDNLMQRFIQEDGTSAVKGDPIRVSTDLQKVKPTLRKWTCDAMVGKDLSAGFAGRSQAQKRVRESRLIFTTCAGAALGLLRAEEFGVVIVDEASQITEPGTLVPLTKGCRRAVLVGDHVQLRATVQKHAILTGYDISLFERLYRLPARQDTAKVMLDTQYRMHPDICAFSSKAFYESKLCTTPGLENLSIPRSQFPWPLHSHKVFIQCDETEDIGRQSKSNKGQVQLCKTICDLLRKPAQPDQESDADSEAEIAILTPYTRQRESLQTALPGLTISSIDGFQGREADIVIFVTVRSNAHHDIGFLSDLRRLNVVMTRAKAGVIVIGHRETLLQERNEGADEEAKRVWKELLGSCETVKLANEV